MVTSLPGSALVLPVIIGVSVLLLGVVVSVTVGAVVSTLPVEVVEVVLPAASVTSVTTEYSPSANALAGLPE